MAPLTRRRRSDESIAVIGMGCRFPGGASDPSKFWDLLKNGIDAVTEIPAERPDGLTSAFASDPTKQQQWSAFVEEVAVNPGTLAQTVENVAAFLMPHAAAAKRR